MPNNAERIHKSLKRLAVQEQKMFKDLGINVSRVGVYGLIAERARKSQQQHFKVISKAVGSKKQKNVRLKIE